MRRVVRPLIVLLVIAAAVAAYWYSQRTPPFLTLTGVVTTNEIVASAQIAGRIGELRVVEGDRVSKDQVLAVLQPDELREERAFYQFSAAGLSSQVAESEAALRLQPERAEAHQGLAEALLAAKRPAEARPHAEAAKRLGRDVQALLKQIDAASK